MSTGGKTILQIQVSSTPDGQSHFDEMYKRNDAATNKDGQASDVAAALSLQDAAALPASA